MLIFINNNNVMIEYVYNSISHMNQCLLLLLLLYGMFIIIIIWHVYSSISIYNESMSKKNIVPTALRPLVYRQVQLCERVDRHGPMVLFNKDDDQLLYSTSILVDLFLCDWSIIYQCIQ